MRRDREVLRSSSHHVISCGPKAIVLPYLSFALLTSHCMYVARKTIVSCPVTCGSRKRPRGCGKQYIKRAAFPPTSRPMALKRELSQSSIGAAPPRKTPRLAPPLQTPRLAPPRPTSRLALTVLTPSSPDPISTASTVVSPSNDDRIPSPSRSSRLTSVPSLSVNSLKKLDSAQLVARLEELAEEYERSVDEMGAEIDHLRREVSFARRRLEATPSLEESDMAAHRASGPGLERGVVLGGAIVSQTLL